MAEHRQHDGEAEEQGNRAENERGGDDQAPKRDRARIGARQPERSLERGHETDVTIEHKRERHDADRKRKRGEAEADQDANDDQRPPAAAGQNVVKEGNRGGRRIGPVEPDIDQFGGEDPGGEDRKQQEAEAENRRERWRAKDGEGVAPSDGEPAFAPPAHLVEADGDERPNDRKAGGERKRQMQRAVQ